MLKNEEVQLEGLETSTQATETDTKADATAKAEDGVNDLFKGLDEDGEGESGSKDHRIPYSRFKEVLAKRDEAEAQTQILQQEVEEMEEVLEDVNKLYGVFEKPYEQMRLDAQFMSIIDKVRDDPDVAPAVAKVMGIIQKGGLTERPVRARNEVERTDARLLATVGVRTETLLEQHKVRPELIPLLVEDVLNSKDIEGNLSDPEILELIKAKVSARKWSAEFLLNKSTKNPARGKNIPEFKGKAPAQAKESKPTTVEEWSARNRARGLAALQSLQNGGDDT